MKTIENQLSQLADSFRAGEQIYTDASHYTEAETRLEFIDKLFILLGWDVNNNALLYPSKREVVVERTNRNSQRPDYTFRIHGIPKFYVEAKKPSVKIDEDTSAIFQARRYGYTDEHPIVVLTNFRLLLIYDASVPVDEQCDRPETGLLFKIKYTELKNEYETLSKYLSRASVGTEEWEELVSAHRPVQYLPAGTQFLQHLRQWRVELGASILTNQPSIDETSLNDLVQLIINRFLFIRMCEDRGLELKDELRNRASKDIVSVNALFAQMDKRYNTGLFKQSPNNRSPLSMVGGNTLLDIIDRLYAPTSPFSYAVLDAEFLGRVYEQSLVEGLRIGQSESGVPTVTLQKKSQYLHRDVVTTPQPLVDAVVEQALNELDDSVVCPKILDFAIGSGRFLVTVYRKLVDLAVTSKLASNNESSLVKRAPNDYTLPFTDKVKIARRQLFGIDIDFNAVEVAKFSILVALLEDETLETLPTGKGILPDIGNNIIHGNSLVRPSLEHPDWVDDPIYAIDLIGAGFNDFDVVLGNPPYVSTEDMRKINQNEFTIIESSYSSLLRQWDKYFAFVEFGITKLTKHGVIGVVIPNKWMTVVSGALFRQLLASNVHVIWLQNFTYHPVFEEKQIYVCGLVASKDKKSKIMYAEPTSVDEISTVTPMYPLERDDWLPSPSSEPWVLPANARQEAILRAIRQNSIKLSEIVEPKNGLQTSANDVFLIKNATKNNDGTVTFSARLRGSKRSSVWTIESDLLVPYLDDSKGVQSFQYVESDSYLLFPYCDDPSRPSGKSLISEQTIKKQYPLTYQYLVAYRERLLKRDKGAQRQMKDGGAFYAYGRGQALGYATQHPKIFYSVNQRGDKYGLDSQGIAFQSGGTAGEVALFPRDTGYDLDFVLGLLAQPEIELFLRKRGSPFRGGFFARGTDVISSVPVPKLDFNIQNDQAFHDEVVSHVQAIRNIGLSLATGQRQIEMKERRMNQRKEILANLFQNRWGLV
ncbi:Eco57I restriction-modification methylase domain-containing protein [Boudabousia marimammalium]|uniref:site-specific DNA-methyltransferase (adenine-specific) n=1 Tax=Boudabousia marimammalium TaxID=156892 RepID=A0A1Q5PSI4_9ACTO|nr:DNA methyltransferase [Boudabousia marimammalium]OKL50469.1 hypothetical protein BM477_00390 [Boudabousia marimammalium]